MWGTPGQQPPPNSYPGQGQQGYGQQQQQCPHQPMMGNMMGAFAGHTAHVMAGTATPGTVAQAGFGMMGAMMNAAATDPAYQQQQFQQQQPPGGYGAPPGGGYTHGGAPPGGGYSHGGAPPGGGYTHGGAPPGSGGYSHGGAPPGAFNVNINVGGAPPGGGYSHGGAPPGSGGYSHGGHSQGHGHAMDDHSFARFLASVQGATFSSDKHNALSLGLGGQRVTCAQVVQLVGAFPHDSDKIQACVRCYPACVDQAHWAEVLNTLAHSSSRDKVMQQIGGGGHSHAPPSGAHGHGGHGGHGGHHGAGHACSQNDFNRFLQSVKSATFSSDKLSAIQIGLQGGLLLNCSQATQVVQALSHDKDKIQAATTLYRAIVDKAHFAEVLNNGLSFSSSRDEVKRNLGL